MSNEIFSDPFGKCRRNLSLVLWVFLLLIYASATHAQHTFTVIADNRPGSPFENFFVPTLNQRGEIAFAATLRSGGAGIYRWGGTPQQTLGTVFEEAVPNFLIPGVFESPAIDPNGRVIFQLGFDGADTVVAGVPGAAPVVVAEPSTAVPSLPNLPNAGTCELARLLSRSTDSTGRALVSCQGTGGGIFLGNGGQLERITGGSVPVSTAIDATWRAEVSSNGVIGGFGFDISTGSSRPVLIRDDAAGTSALLFVDLLNGNEILASRADLLGINDSGRIAFSAFWNIVGGGPAIFTIDTAGQPLPVIDPRSGVYRSPRMPSITNGGQVAFVDTLRGGLFTGVDPILNKVVSRGDSLPCSPQAGNQLCPSPGNFTVPGFLTSVSDVYFQHPGINSGGQLVFLVEFGRGLQAIVRAEPPNAKPVINNPGDQLIEEGFFLAQQLIASDPDNDIPFTWNITIPGALGLIGDMDGLISGTPAPGTTDQAFTIEATVRDARNADSDPVQFVWTVTPGRRTGLTARANPNGLPASIDLTWTNPSPDSAASIEVEIIGGPTVRLGAGATTYRFAGVQDVNYCFRVRGVSAGGLRSPNSNSDCEVFPTLTIENIVATPTADGVAITWTTSLRANILFAGLSPTLPGGATTRVEVTNATQTSFRFTATGLASATPYNLHINAQSIPGLLSAQADAPFMTSAAGGGGRGNGRGQRNAPLLNVQAVGDLRALRRSEMAIDVIVSNDSRASVTAQNVRIGLATNVEWRCPPITNQCFSPGTITSSLVALPVSIGTLAPGDSRRLTLLFLFQPSFILTTGGPAKLNVFLDYFYLDGATNVSNSPPPFTRTVLLPLGDVAPAPISADLKVDILRVTPKGFLPAYVNEITVTFRIINFGPADAHGVSVEVAMPFDSTFTHLNSAGTSPGILCGRFLSCTIPDLPRGEFKDVVFHARAPTRTSTITVSVHGSRGWSDPDPEPNSRTADIPDECIDGSPCP